MTRNFIERVPDPEEAGFAKQRAAEAMAELGQGSWPSGRRGMPRETGEIQPFMGLAVLGETEEALIMGGEGIRSSSDLLAVDPDPLTGTGEDGGGHINNMLRGGLVVLLVTLGGCRGEIATEPTETIEIHDPNLRDPNGEESINLPLPSPTPSPTSEPTVQPTRTAEQTINNFLCRRGEGGLITRPGEVFAAGGAINPEGEDLPSNYIPSVLTVGQIKEALAQIIQGEGVGDSLDRFNREGTMERIAVTIFTHPNEEGESVVTSFVPQEDSGVSPRLATLPAFLVEGDQVYDLVDPGEGRYESRAGDGATAFLDPEVNLPEGWTIGPSGGCVLISIDRGVHGVRYYVLVLGVNERGGDPWIGTGEHNPVFQPAPTPTPPTSEPTPTGEATAIPSSTPTPTPPSTEEPVLTPTEAPVPQEPSSGEAPPQIGGWYWGGTGVCIRDPRGLIFTQDINAPGQTLGPVPPPGSLAEYLRTNYYSECGPGYPVPFFKARVVSNNGVIMTEEGYMINPSDTPLYAWPDTPEDDFFYSYHQPDYGVVQPGAWILLAPKPNSEGIPDPNAGWAAMMIMQSKAYNQEGCEAVYGP